MTEWEKFLDFEKKYRLFDIKDNEGTYVWNLIRLYVYNMIAYGSTPSPPRNDESKKTFTDRIRSLIVTCR